ncbi:MAG: double zinc ribbon domain-containing protein [Solirubrobacterales bacterium]
MQLALFGIDGGALSLIISLLVLFLVIVYLALIYWTYLDAKRRIQDPVLIACATAASAFPFVGTVVYTILRPPEFLEDREERELELRAAELRLRELIEHSCPHCEYPVSGDYLRCPNCERSLRSPCRRCSKPLDPKWGICPYCEAEVRRARPERVPSRETGRRAERPRRAERSERAERTARAERSERTERPERASRASRSAERSASPPAKPTERPRRAKRQPVSEKDGSTERERTERPTRRVTRPSS